MITTSFAVSWLLLKWACGAPGKDCSDEFDEIGHSKAAQEMLKKWEIGDFEVRSACFVSLLVA